MRERQVSMPGESASHLLHQGDLTIDLLGVVDVFEHRPSEDLLHGRLHTEVMESYSFMITR